MFSGFNIKLHPVYKEEVLAALLFFAALSFAAITPTTQFQLSASNFGVICDGSTDVTTKLQTAVNALQNASNHGEGMCLEIPAGVCVITDPILITSDDDTSSFNTACVRGAGLSAASDIQSTVIDHTAIVDGPAFDITAGRAVLVEKLSFEGPNTDPSGLSYPSIIDSDYATSGVRTNSLSPQAAITVDALAGNPSGTTNDYPGLTHRATVSGSLRVQLRDINIEDSYVGVMVSPNGESNQGDDVEMHNVNVDGARSCFAWGQSQSRSNSVINGSCTDAYIAFDGTSFGDGTGSGISAFEVQLVGVTNVFSFAHTLEEPLILNGIDGERILSLGRWGTGFASVSTPMTISNSRFSMGETGQTQLPPPYFIEAHGITTFSNNSFDHAYDDLVEESDGGGATASPYEYALNILTQSGQFLIEGSTFRMGLDADNFIPIGRSRDFNEGRVAIQNSWYDPASGTSRIMTDDYYQGVTFTDRFPIHPSTRFLQHRGDVYALELGDTAEYENISGDTITAVCHKTIPYDAETGTFTEGLTVTGGTSGATGVLDDLIDSGTTGELCLDTLTGTFVDNETVTDTSTGSATTNIPSGAQYGEIRFQISGGEEDTIQVGDVIQWQFESYLGGADAQRMPGCLVSSVTGSSPESVVCEMLFYEAYYDTSFADINVYRNFWAVEPGVTLECDFNTSTALTGCTNESILAVGDWLNSSISGISNNTRITAVGSGSATLNRAATNSNADTVLYDSQWQTLTD